MFKATEYEMNYYLRMSPRRYYICIWKMEFFLKNVAFGTGESLIHFGFPNEFITSI